MSGLKQFYEQDYFCKWLEISNPELNDYRRAENVFLFNHIRVDSTLLDVGVGTGRSLEAILERVSRAHGIDFSELMLKEAQKLLGQNPKVELKQADAENMPYEDGTFDYVISALNTYGNFENPSKCLDEMLRVVKPDGEVILGVYSQKALETQLRTYEEVGLNIESYDEEAVYTREGLISRRFTKEKLKEIANQHGAQIEIKELTEISYIAILKKVNI